MIKLCNTCKIEKDFSEFSIRKDTGKPVANCKKCRNTWSKHWRLNNPEKFKAIVARARPKQLEYYRNGKGKVNNRKGLLTRIYNIDQETYDNMILDQQGVCAICKRPETRDKTKYLSVDHDHLTNKVRGLLCAKCNSALGQFEDNIEVMENAILYLKKYK